MVLITEFRIKMPLNTEEYQRGQLYGIAELSREGSGKNGEGVEVKVNEPFDNEMGKGQHTKKIYHVGNSLPSFFLMVLPTKALDVHEDAWSAYPYCKTVLSCPLLGERFNMTIISMYKDNDDGNTYNIHNLTTDMLAKRKVVKLDIANDEFPNGCTDDPRKYKSEITGRGPLFGPEWEKKQTPIMWCYKIVIVEMKIWGLQNKIEQKILEFERNLFLRLHRRMFCTIDQWINLSMEQIRAIEDETAKELHTLFEEDQKLQKKGQTIPSSPKAAPGSEAELISVQV
jgi:hypothetical protein